MDFCLILCWHVCTTVFGSLYVMQVSVFLAVYVLLYVLMDLGVVFLIPLPWCVCGLVYFSKNSQVRQNWVRIPALALDL